MGRDPRRVDTLIGELAKAYGWTDKWNEHRVLEAYRSSVDTAMLNATEKAYVQKRVLHLHLHQAAARNNMQYQLNTLKEAINQNLGSPYLLEIRLV